jgi:hypothetical protein
MIDRIISATRASTAEAIAKLPLVRSVRERLFGGEYDLVTNNTRGLPAVYNEALEVWKKQNARWLVFVHDDVYIDDAHVFTKLEEAHQQHGFNIIGLAGCKDPVIKSHNLWHVMAPREKLFGYAAHPAGQPGQIQVSSFGPSPSRVALIDGLFIAVHVPTVAKTNWKFNENYTFHHYDLASCIDANRQRLKIGVAPINVIHSSPGLMSVNDTIWSKSNDQFLKEYGVGA